MAEREAKGVVAGQIELKDWRIDLVSWGSYFFRSRVSGTDSKTKSAL